ncbi:MULTISPECIES: hypothetical protein [unclassified Streptomyces]|uniref:hypothetical protein n=1 Tax=unclassified Streptomyces TaxID=2593676 RepID=UPI00332755FD
MCLIKHEESAVDEASGHLPAETSSGLPSGSSKILEFAHLHETLAAEDQLTVVALVQGVQADAHQRLQPVDQLLVPASGQLVF